LVIGYWLLALLFHKSQQPNANCQTLFSYK